MASTPTQAADDIVIHPAAGGTAGDLGPNKSSAPGTTDIGSLSKRNLWAWRSLRDLRTRQKIFHESHRLSDASTPKNDSQNEPAYDDDSWSTLQKQYPESVLSRVTGTTLVGDNDSFISMPASSIMTDRPSTALDNYDVSKSGSTRERTSMPGSASRPSSFDPTERRTSSSLSYRSRILSTFRSMKRDSSIRDKDDEDALSTYSNDTVILAQELGAINRVVEELEDTLDTSKATELVLPSSFLNLDLYCQKHTACRKGATTHHRNRCICFDFRKSPENYWVSSSSISTRALNILNSRSISNITGQLHDCFGNTVLHLIAARAKHSTLIQSLDASEYSTACVTNSGGQTFLHALREDWYSDDALALYGLTLELRSAGFRIQAQDVYGQTLAHLACRKIEDSHTLGRLLRLFDSTTLSKRDAFGLKPESMTLLGNDADKSSLLQQEPVPRGPDGSAGIEVLWRLDLAAPEENASPVDFAAYEVRILRVTREATEKAETEDAQGRNGFHCLAAAIFARLKYLFSGLLETSAFTRRHVWTAWTLNDQAETTSRAQLVRSALSQAAKYIAQLLECGVDINSYNSFGNTVLMDFVAFLPEEAGNLQTMEILQILIHAGARLEARNRNGETALLVAARCCRKTAVKALVEAGASIHARDADGRDAVTILKDCLAKTVEDTVAAVNYEGCLNELLGRCEGFIPASTATSEWCLPHREAKELEPQVVDAPPNENSQTPSEQLVLEIPPSEAVSFQLEEEVLEVDPFKLTLYLEGDAATRSSLVSTIEDEATCRQRSQLISTDVLAPDLNILADEETDCRQQRQPTSTDSLSPDLNSLTDDMCDLILSRAFGLSMDDVSSPQDAWSSVRKCMGELSFITSEPLAGEYSPIATESEDQEIQDNETPQKDSSNQTFPALQPGNSSRKRSLYSGSRNEDDPDGDGFNSKRNGGGRDNSWEGNIEKNAKRPKGEVRLSCPFRKRNPLRFNVRDHLNCATQSFPSITLVKRHIATFHKQKTSRVNQHFTCSRCQEKFGTLKERDDHLRVSSSDQICPLRDAIENPVVEDPEDGITDEVADKLRDRRLKISVTTWVALWQALFPQDEEVKSDEFEPVIEADEVKKAFERNAGRCASALQKVSSNMILGASSVTHQELGHTLWGLFQSFIDHTLQACRDMLIGSPVYGVQRQLAPGLARMPLSLDLASGSNHPINDQSLINALLGLQSNSISDRTNPGPSHTVAESFLATQSSQTADSVLFPTREIFNDHIGPPPKDASDNQTPSEFGPMAGIQDDTAFEDPPRSSVVLGVSGNQCGWCSLPTPCECLQDWALNQTFDVLNNTWDAEENESNIGLAMG